MGYNSNNETREELVKLQKNNRGDFIIGAKIKNNNTGNESIDIRMFYTDDSDELRPTSKGVRFNSEGLMDLLIGLAKGLEQNEVEDLGNEIMKLAEKMESDDDEDKTDTSGNETVEETEGAEE